MEIVYIETSIVSYLVARPSRDPQKALWQSVTREWWEVCRPRYHCMASDEVVLEAGRGDPDAAKQRLVVLSGMPKIAVTTEMRHIARLILKMGALAEGDLTDAIHLAASFKGGADFLLTWNCKHLANGPIKRRLEKEAMQIGWTLPTVCTPLELIGGR